MISAKTCTQCGVMTPIEDFPPAVRRSDGRGSQCRPCLRQRAAKVRLKKGMTPRRVVAPGHAYCPDCRTERPVDEFPTNPSTRTGRGAYCLPCHNARGRDNKIANHGSTRSYHLKRRYDLTESEVDAMVQAQGGLCALCRRKPAEHVDHCHLTGQVRGILCFTCNVGLGNFGDSEQLMRLAADYLRGHQTTDPSVIDDGAEWDFSGGYTEGA